MLYQLSYFRIDYWFISNRERKGSDFTVTAKPLRHFFYQIFSTSSVNKRVMTVAALLAATITSAPSFTKPSSK